jgi:hypothetical protein
MGLPKEREAIKKIGQFPRQWAEKVDAMSDNQVMAIYLRLKAKGQLPK